MRREPAEAAARGDPAGAAPQVALRCERDASGRTFLARKFATYPFFCAAPFYLDRTPPGMLTLILQSMSGGLYEEDRLALSIDACAGAELHCTTQGATVAHGMPHGGEARQRVGIRAAAGSFVEHLPDPLILMPAASVRSRVDVVAEVGATVILGDAFLTHDPERRGRSFRSLSNEVSIRRPRGGVLCAERYTVSGDEAVDASGQLRPRHDGLGCLLVCSPYPAADLAAALQEAVGSLPGVYGGASALPNDVGASCRFLAVDAIALAGAFRAAWYAVRRALTGEEPLSRRKSGWL